MPPIGLVFVVALVAFVATSYRNNHKEEELRRSLCRLRPGDKIQLKHAPYPFKVEWEEGDMPDDHVVTVARIERGHSGYVRWLEVDFTSGRTQVFDPQDVAKAFPKQ